MADNEIPQKRWDRLKGELLAYRQSEAEMWGGIDDGLLARYIVGQCNDGERTQVDKAAAAFPAVRDAIAVLRDALGEDSVLSATSNESSTVTAEAGFGTKETTVGVQRPINHSQSIGRRNLWIPIGITMTVVSALVVVIVMQRLEIQRLVEQNNKARNQTSAGFELQWTKGDLNGPVDWQALLNQLYDPKLSDAENLSRLQRLGGDQVREKIEQLRAQKPSPNSEKILSDLFDHWGAPPNRAERVQ